MGATVLALTKSIYYIKLLFRARKSHDKWKVVIKK